MHKNIYIVTFFVFVNSIMLQAMDHSQWLAVKGASVLLDSNNLPESVDCGMRLLEEAADLGNQNAMSTLGCIYQFGYFGCKEDFSKTREYYEKAGNGEAFNNLGYMYYKGLGVNRDYSIAKDYFEKGMQQDYPKAWNNMGKMYFNGTGVEKNLNSAEYYFIGALNLGYTKAIEHLNILTYEKLLSSFQEIKD